MIWPRRSLTGGASVLISIIARPGLIPCWRGRLSNAYHGPPE